MQLSTPRPSPSLTPDAPATASNKIQIMQGLSLQAEIFRQILACAADLSLGLIVTGFVDNQTPTVLEFILINRLESY